jgi:hypothetical protein
MDNIELLCFLVYRIQLKSYFVPYEKVFGFSGFTKVALQIKLQNHLEPKPLFITMVQNPCFIKLYQNTKQFLQKLAMDGEEALQYLEPTFEKIAHYFRMIQDVNIFDQSNGSTLYSVIVVCLFYSMRDLNIPLLQFSLSSMISLQPLQYLVEQFTKSTAHPHPLDTTLFPIQQWSQTRTILAAVQRNVMDAIEKGTNGTEKDREHLYTLFPLTIYFIWTLETGNTNRINTSSLSSYALSKDVLIQPTPSSLYTHFDAYFHSFLDHTFDLLVKSNVSFDVAVCALLYVCTFRLHTQLQPEQMTWELLYQVALVSIILAEESIYGLVSVETWASYSGYSCTDLEQIITKWFGQVQGLDTVQDIEYYSYIIRPMFKELVCYYLSMMDMVSEVHVPVNPTEHLTNVMGHFVDSMFQQLFIENYPVSEKILFNLHSLYKKIGKSNPERCTYFYVWDCISPQAFLGLVELHAYALEHTDLAIVVAQRNVECTMDIQSWYVEIGLCNLPNVILLQKIPTLHQDYFSQFPSEYGFLIHNCLLLYKGVGFGHAFVHNVPRCDRITVLEHIDIVGMLYKYRTDFIIDLDKKKFKVGVGKETKQVPQRDELVQDRSLVVHHYQCNPLDHSNPVVGTRFEPIKVLGNSTLYLNPNVIPTIIRKRKWIIHFWNHYTHKFRNQYHWLRAIANNQEFAVVTVQMDQSVDFKLLFEEVRGLDISSIAIINDFPGFFKRFYLSVMGDFSGSQSYYNLF